MYTLKLDIELTFSPLMNETDAGICLNRTLELPFPPSNGLSLAGLAFDESPELMDFKLKNVMWHLDRQVFFATTSLISVDLPIALIANEIRGWLNRGWRFGSSKDVFTESEKSIKKSRIQQDIGDFPVDDELLEKWPMMGVRSRPKSFNVLLLSLVREMSKLYNNWHIAYAIDKTKMFFTEKQLQENENAATIKFREAQTEFNRMPFEQIYDWQEKVRKKHPRLDRIITFSGGHL